ncbi:hypothetical protein ACOMHN_003510 [Nucella lapillus]
MVSAELAEEAACINIGVLVMMRLWQPHPDSVLPLFVITAMLGLTDGIWNVNANGLCGSMFPEHYEEAFTGLRIAQGLGGAVSMAYAPALCMAVKIYIMMACAALVCLGYLGADVLIRREARHRKDLLFEKDVA